PGSVHTTLFPEPADLTAGITAAQRERLAGWDRLMEVRQEVMKSLEAARRDKFIGAPLEACVRIAAPGEVHALLEQHREELAALFIVSQVQLENGDRLAVSVERAAGVKCERCWKYAVHVGYNAQLPTVCADCAAVIVETMRDPTCA
ncbi:MAG: isoleucine--tRNA ligase, partial [Candidatus Solibacter usitatus]|nr:isoleucine--tRNA ligase [Candidatus Solibacter usitatus]